MFPIPMQRRAVQQLLQNHNGVGRRLLGDAAAAPVLRRRLFQRHLTAVALPTTNHHPYNHPPFAARQQQPQVRGFFVHAVPPNDQPVEQEDTSTFCASSRRLDCSPTCGGDQDDDDGG